MKVKVSLIYLEVLSQGLLRPSMKTIHKTSYDQGTSLRIATETEVTVTIPLFFKSRAKN
jgi:hypothetical protein